MSEKLSISTPLSSLVARNSFFASALHNMGITYPKYPTSSLVEACHESGVSVFVAVNKLHSIETDYKYITELQEYPVELTVSYLRYMHRLIIRERLPYVQDLAEMIHPDDFTNRELAHDLKTIIPVYVEDFIRHIHEEEDELFDYVIQLSRASKRTNLMASILFKYRHYSMQTFALEHAHEDETNGIRLVTNDYQLHSSASSLEKIVIHELKAFDAEMDLHARIENELLMPKAIQLEKDVIQKCKIVTPYN